MIELPLLEITNAFVVYVDDTMLQTELIFVAQHFCMIIFPVSML